MLEHIGVEEQRTGKKIFFSLVLLGALVRILLWWWIPSSQFASDEGSYIETGLKLATTGEQDLFWPPVIGWLIAAISTISGSESAALFRLFWILIDLGNMLLLRMLVIRLTSAASSNFSGGAHFWLPNLAVAFYISYIPIIGFSEFATSETPSLLFLLAVLVLLKLENLSAPRVLIAGLTAGILVLTRSNVAVLLLTIPCAVLLALPRDRRAPQLRKAILFILAGSAVVGLYIARNFYVAGRLVLSNNSAYNLYIGNADVYQEDLNLFCPRATPEQIRFRKEYSLNQGKVPESGFKEMQNTAVNNILDHPLLFLRRASGRLARIFVPKTSPLQLLGGESSAGIFSPAAMILLLVSNVQYGFILFFGFAGLLCLDRFSRSFQIFFSAVIIGCIPLCLVAISKPRYSASFEPILMICAFVFILDLRRNLVYIWQKRKILLVILSLFFIWAWMAWAVFSVSSRVALNA